jgi:multicomponent Na+:H+ antiporter subunit E
MRKDYGESFQLSPSICKYLEGICKSLQHLPANCSYMKEVCGESFRLQIIIIYRGVLMKRNISLFFCSFLFSFLIYIFLVNPFVPAINTAELAAGVVISLIAAFFVFRIFPLTMHIFHPGRIFAAIRYLPWFLYKVVKANLEIAAIVLHPKLPVKPAVLKGTMTLKQRESQLLLTSSITLTPGTLTVDTADNEVTIHYVKTDNAGPADVEKETLQPFEKRIKGITE